MAIEFNSIHTKDDLEHIGILSKTDSPNYPEECFLLIHGSSGNFFGAMNLALMDRFGEAGFDVASFNTRGHDLISRYGERFYGNAFDILSECNYDIDAAVSFLVERGYKKIHLYGHSMGAVKVVYYGAKHPNPYVISIISSSPVRLSYDYFMNHPDAVEEFTRCVNLAKEHIKNNKPNALMDVQFPMPHTFGAKAYLDKHGSEQYNMTLYAQNVTNPTLLIAGSLETHPRLENCATDTHEIMKSSHEKNSVVIVEGADHAWTDMHDQHAKEILNWIANL